MNDLPNKKCVLCEREVNLLSKKDAQDYLDEIYSWSIDEEVAKIFKEFIFKDFVQAIDFINKVAGVAEKERHHKVTLELTTHAISEFSENDFILTTKINSYN